MTLEQVLADHREQANVLRGHGHTTQARSIDALADAVGEAMRSYLTILSEKEAALRSGWTTERLRGRFPEWERQGFAMLRGKKREYRECIVPVRAALSIAREAGRRGERAS